MTKKSLKPFNFDTWTRLRNDYVVKSNAAERAKEKMRKYDREHSEDVKYRAKKRKKS